MNNACLVVNYPNGFSPHMWSCGDISGTGTNAFRGKWASQPCSDRGGNGHEIREKVERDLEIGSSLWGLCVERADAEIEKPVLR